MPPLSKIWVRHIGKIISHLVPEKVQVCAWHSPPVFSKPFPSALFTLTPAQAPVPYPHQFLHSSSLLGSLLFGQFPLNSQDAKYPLLPSPTLNSLQGALLSTVRLKGIIHFRATCLYFMRRQLESWWDLKFSVLLPTLILTMDNLFWLCMSN